jgi:Mn2+/Fe2+ NRAMP family transporter
VLILLTLALGVVQEMAARLGIATGSGLLELIRGRFGIGWAVLAVTVIVVANVGITATEFLGVAAASEIFGISRWISVPLAAAVVWVLVLRGSYKSAERVFLAMTLAFLAYPIAAVLAHPDWTAVARGAFVPSFHMESGYLLILVALVGTTITPYQQLFQQSAVVDKGVGPPDYKEERLDAILGAVVGNLIWAFVIIATAATLRPAGITNIDTAADAARALEPLAGPAAQSLFAFGLLGASLLAGAIVPLTTAYSVSEALGLPKGVSLNFREAPLFFGFFTALIVLGGAVALVPGVPLVGLLVGIQVFNGILLPVVLVFIVLLSSDRRLMRDLTNTRLQSLLGWSTLILVTLSVALLLVSQLPGYP